MEPLSEEEDLREYDNDNSSLFEEKRAPLYQKIFVIFRPGWKQYAKLHISLSEISGSLGDLGTIKP